MLLLVHTHTHTFAIFVSGPFRHRKGDHCFILSCFPPPPQLPSTPPLPLPPPPPTLDGAPTAPPRAELSFIYRFLFFSLLCFFLQLCCTKNLLYPLPPHTPLPYVSNDHKILLLLSFFFGTQQQQSFFCVPSLPSPSPYLFHDPPPPPRSPSPSFHCFSSVFLF